MSGCHEGNKIIGTRADLHTQIPISLRKKERTKNGRQGSPGHGTKSRTINRGSGHGSGNDYPVGGYWGGYA